MRSVNMIILHAYITPALANQNVIEQNLIDRLKSVPLHDANLDVTTFAKPHASTNVGSLATMNRPLLPLTQGRVGLSGSPTNRQTFGRVAASLDGQMVAARYAEGLFKLADDKNELETVKAGADSLKLILSQVPELSPTLGDPMTSPDQKKALIDKMVEKGTTHTFCNLLVDKQRVDLLEPILRAFDTMYNEKQDIEECQVTSACKMTEEQLFTIAKTVRKQTGAKSVKIREAIDEYLIGGFVLSFGGQQVDLSIRSGLDAIRQQLASSSLLPKKA